MTETERQTIRTFMRWCCQEQIITKSMELSYMPNVSAEFRKGYIKALRSVESKLGLLMIERNFDLRDISINPFKKYNAKT